MRNKSAKSGQRKIRKFARFRRKAEKTAVRAADKSIEHIEENLIGRVHKISSIRLLILEWCLMVLAIIILAIVQSFWFTDSYSTTGFASGGTFIEGTLGQVDSLNPLFATTSSERALSRLLFATLSTPDYSGHIGPGLASSIKAEQNGKVWRVHLRDDLKWSDGEPLDIDDVIFSVNLIQSPKLSTSYSSNLAGVTVKKGDDDSIIFVLPSAYADFAAALNIPILPEHILKDADPALLLEHSFSSSPVSSGPFRYNATQITNGEAVVYLSANPYYYNSRPKLDSFAIHSFDSLDKITAALSSGAITATAELPPTQADQITNPTIYEKQTTISSGIYLFLNTSSSVFKSKAARQAVQKGLDMPAIRGSVLGDEPALDYPILSSQINLKTWPALPAYNPEESRQTLAPYSDKTIHLATIDSGYFPALGEKITAALQDLGLDVSLDLYSAGQEFSGSVIAPRDYDLLLYEIELGADPDLFAYYHSSQTGDRGLNLSNYNDSVTDKLIIAARSTINDNTRRGEYEAFLSRWVENAPAIGIYQANMSYLLNRNVRAFSEDNTLITPIDRFTDIEMWSASKTTKFKTP